MNNNIVNHSFEDVPLRLSSTILYVGFLFVNGVNYPLVDLHWFFEIFIRTEKKNSVRTEKKISVSL